MIIADMLTVYLEHAHPLCCISISPPYVYLNVTSQFFFGRSENPWEREGREYASREVIFP
jgi:hypothetical protein